MTSPTRYDRVHVALVAAGDHGVHWKTLRNVGGRDTWLKHLNALAAAGATLRRLPEPALPHKFWRVILVEDVPVPSAAVEPEPEAPVLFEPPSERPISAVTGERVEEVTRAQAEPTRARDDSAVPASPPASVVDVDDVVAGLMAMEETAQGDPILRAISAWTQTQVIPVHPETFEQYESLLGVIRMYMPVVIEPILVNGVWRQVAFARSAGLDIRVFAPLESMAVSA